MAPLPSGRGVCLAHVAEDQRTLRGARALRFVTRANGPQAFLIAMSLKINELCVNCDVCEPACPNQAISMGETIYVIDPARCTECVGHFDEPQCVVVCPVECIDPDPDFPESQDDLLAKLRRLQVADAASR